MADVDWKRLLKKIQQRVADARPPLGPEDEVAFALIPTGHVPPPAWREGAHG